jgi:hypothetical protein
VKGIAQILNCAVVLTAISFMIARHRGFNHLEDRLSIVGSTLDRFLNFSCGFQIRCTDANPRRGDHVSEVVVGQVVIERESYSIWTMERGYTKREVKMKPIALGRAMWTTGR